MWTRQELKNSAKSALKGRYWWAVLVSAIFGIVNTMGLNSLSGNAALPISGILNADRLKSASGQLPDGTTVTLKGMFETIIGQSHADDAVQMVIATIVIILSIYLLAIVIIFLIKALIQIFFVNPVMVAKNVYYVNNRNNMGRVRDLVTSFTRGSYSSIVKTMFMRDLYVGLWSLLFIIPGIIKYYSYFMVPYIVAENPSISVARAFEISKKTMHGQKWKLFVLQLSFLGWILLGSIVFFGAGLIFLEPYMEATYVEFYETMKEKALKESTLLPGELPVITTEDIADAKVIGEE